MNLVQVPLAHPQLFAVFAPRVNVPFNHDAPEKPEIVTVPARVPQEIVSPPDQACVPPVGQNEFDIVIVTFPLPSTDHAVPLPDAFPVVACHDDQQFVVERSMQPRVLFQSEGKASHCPSGLITPIAFCPLKFQLSFVLNVWPSR